MKRVEFSNGSIAALKWLGLILMTGDHANKYLFNGTLPYFFEFGRLCVPIFVFVLAYNFARPNILSSGAYGRTMKRLAVAGGVASIPFVALGKLQGGWWPLNILFLLLALTAILYLLDEGGIPNQLGAFVIFLIGGSSVEYWWVGLLLGIVIWKYFKDQTKSFYLALIALVCACLFIINKNYWAMAAIPLIAGFSQLKFNARRTSLVFYIYYPLHLTVLWLIRIPMGKAGYLFF